MADVDRQRRVIYAEDEMFVARALMCFITNSYPNTVSVQPSAVDFSSFMTISEKLSFLNWHVCMTEEITS